MLEDYKEFVGLHRQDIMSMALEIIQRRLNVKSGIRVTTRTEPKSPFHPNIFLVNKFVDKQDISRTKMIPIDWSTRWFMVDSE